MMPNTTLRRIGVVDQSSSYWAAASTFTTMLVSSLDAACREAGIELCLLSEMNGVHQELSGEAKLISLEPFENLPGELRVRRLLRLRRKAGSLHGETRLRHWLHVPDRSDVFSAARAQGIDVLLPLLDLPFWKLNLKTIGWIPDFQHVYLPRFFLPAERERRDDSMTRLTEKANLILLSSRTALEHFTAFAPAQVEKARVVPFPSLFAFRQLDTNATVTVSKYNLPEKFALVANQFWAHKNHLVVVEAIRQLRERGLDIPVVMTGLPADHRDPSNENLSRLMQAIASANLSGQITILGHVPYSDYVNLMRTATVVVQPSRFEGWSTIVQDAKALGRPLLCSDIPVHREQVPQALGFFACDDALALAELLASRWPSLAAGPEPLAEARALTTEREFAKQHGELLLRICIEAHGMRRNSL